MGDAYYKPIATTLGLAGLVRQGFIETFTETDRHDNTISFCRITPTGWAFLVENVSLVELKEPPLSPSPAKPPAPPTEDEIPF